MSLHLLILPLIIFFIVSYGVYKKVPVYERFIEGAKEGFDIAIRIMPYLVAMLFAIALFRASGAMLWFAELMSPVLVFFGVPEDVITMAIIRPLTGSGSVAVLADLIEQHGIHSDTVRTAATLFGSTETTFYVIAVYLGAVAIHKTRYAIKVGLLADFAGFVAAVLVIRWWFN